MGLLGVLLISAPFTDTGTAPKCVEMLVTFCSFGVVWKTSKHRKQRPAWSEYPWLSCSEARALTTLIWTKPGASVINKQKKKKSCSSSPELH